MTNEYGADLIEPLVDRFYQGKDREAALIVFKEYKAKITNKAIKILTELLQERQALLDSSEPFFDRVQLTSAIDSSLGLEWDVGRPYFEGNSGGRNSVLARVVGKIALEGFVEANSHEPRELE